MNSGTKRTDYDDYDSGEYEEQSLPPIEIPNCPFCVGQASFIANKHLFAVQCEDEDHCGFRGPLSDRPSLALEKWKDICGFQQAYNKSKR